MHARWRAGDRAGRTARHASGRTRRGGRAGARTGIRDRVRRRVRQRASTTRERHSCAPAVARWLAEEGLEPGRLHRRRTGRRTCRRTSRPSGSECTATTSPSPSCAEPSPRASGRSSWIRCTEIARLNEVARAARRAPSGAGAGDGRRRGAHPRVHRDRPRRSEVRLRAGRRPADDAIAAVLSADSLELVGLHSHIGSQIFDTSGFEVAAHRVVELAARVGYGVAARRS